MKRARILAFVWSVGAFGSVLQAGIPEPDAILYGAVSLNGVPVQQRDAVVLRARLAGGQEIGRFDFGDCNADGVADRCELSCANSGCTGVAGCGTARDTSPADGLLDDCPGHQYALKVRCESTPTGIAPSGTAAILNPASPTVVRILMQRASGPEMHIRNLIISERGKIRQIALSLLNLLAYKDLAACSGGPNAASPGGSCTAAKFISADYEDDGDADLRDYAFLQNQFVPQ